MCRKLTLLWCSIIPPKNKVCLSICSSQLVFSRCCAHFLFTPEGLFSVLLFLIGFLYCSSLQLLTVRGSEASWFLYVFEFILPEVCQVSWTCGFMYFIKFGEFSGIIFANIFSSPFSQLSCGTPIAHKIDLMIPSHGSLGLFFGGF